MAKRSSVITQAHLDSELPIKTNCTKKPAVGRASTPNVAYFSHSRTPALMVGRSPWTAADASSACLRCRKALIQRAKGRVPGDPRGPLGPPYNLCRIQVSRKVCGIRRPRLPGSPPDPRLTPFESASRPWRTRAVENPACGAEDAPGGCSLACPAWLLLGVRCSAPSEKTLDDPDHATHSSIIA